MGIIWRDGRMVGAEGYGVRLNFEAMPDEGVEALRMLRGGEYVGVMWFAPFSVNAEIVVGGQRLVLDGFTEPEDLVGDVLERLSG